MSTLYAKPPLTIKTMSLCALTVIGALTFAACSKQKPTPAPISRVLVTTVDTSDDHDSRTFFATLQPRFQTNLSFRASGKIIKRHVDLGDHVAAGQVLAELDPADYVLASNAAKDQLQAAKITALQAASDEGRFKRLMQSGAVGSADHERQKARADAAAAMRSQAEQNVALASNKLSYLSLRAPNAGVITALNFETGQLVAEGTPVAQLAQENSMEVVCDVPETMANDLHTWHAKAMVNNDVQKTLTLNLREVSPAASPLGKTFQAKYSIVGGDSALISNLKQGQSLTIELSRQLVTSTHKIPATAILRTNAQAFVWGVTSQNLLVAVPVTIEKYTNTDVYVSGLAPNTRIVTAGVHKLEAHMAVDPIERSNHGAFDNAAYGPAVIAPAAASAHGAHGGAITP